jgi:hypothetical protein
MTAAFNQMLAQGPTPIKFADPVNQMAQLMQLKNAQQTGVVNQMAIDKGNRQQADQAAYRNMLAQPGFDVNDPATQARMLRLGGGEDLAALGTLAKNQIDVDTRRQALADEAYEREVEGYKAAAPYNGSREQIAQHFELGLNNPILKTRGVFAQPGAREGFMAKLASDEGFAELQRMSNSASSGVSQLDRAKIVRQEQLGAGGGAGGTLESGGNVQQAVPYQTGAYSVITRSGQQKVYDPNGKEVFGEDAARVVREGYAAGIVNTGQGAQARQAGTDAAKAGTAAFAEVNRIRGASRLYDQAISAIDSGSQSGALNELFPSVFAPTVNLEYIRDQLGLAVIAGTTFGALSEAELRLAMNQGLPTGLEGPKLKEWIIGKKAADAKLATYLESQAKYLEGGGSRGGWLKMTGAKTTDAGGATATASERPSPEDEAEVARIMGRQ